MRSWGANSSRIASVVRFAFRQHARGHGVQALRPCRFLRQEARDLVHQRLGRRPATATFHRRGPAQLADALDRITLRVVEQVGVTMGRARIGVPEQGPDQR